MLVLEVLPHPRRAVAGVRDTAREARRLSVCGSTGDRHGAAKRSQGRRARRSRGRGGIRGRWVEGEASCLR